MPIWVCGVEQYTGQVVALQDRGYHDGWYRDAIIWENGHTRTVCVDTDCFAPCGCGLSHAYRIDTDSPAMAEYQAMLAEHAAKSQRMAERIEDATPRIGKRLNVFKGRKVPKGTEGECFWIGHSNYGMRVGIRDAAGTAHFTSIDNVQVV